MVFDSSSKDLSNFLNFCFFVESIVDNCETNGRAVQANPNSGNKSSLGPESLLSMSAYFCKQTTYNDLIVEIIFLFSISYLASSFMSAYSYNPTISSFPTASEVLGRGRKQFCFSTSGNSFRIVEP